jgi:hypothetical protein
MCFVFFLYSWLLYNWPFGLLSWHVYKEQLNRILIICVYIYIYISYRRMIGVISLVASSCFLILCLCFSVCLCLFPNWSSGC